MPKVKTKYVCQSCGATFVKWQGRCPECGAWNSIVEERIDTQQQAYTSASYSARQEAKSLNQVDFVQYKRIFTNISELDRVLGGGFVPGSVVLLGGDPGIGKSTLALQLAFNAGVKVLYVSGEESLEQIKLRALRIGKITDNVLFLSEVMLEEILAIVEQEKPMLVIVDSVQTTQTSAIDSSPGSVSQIREVASRIQQYAKSKGITFLLIGHITKEGVLAGPKLLEHIVDAVLQFEGDRNHMYRILRSVKNRFGSTSEIGIFEMKHAGLVEVSNPSQLLMSPSKEPVSGVTISASVEGMRPFMIEVQALVSRAVYGTPQRSAIGFDTRRMSMLLAVLEKRLGLKLGNKDVFLNIAGGVKVDDPGIDLSVASSIISSDQDIVVPKDICFTAEVGLTGEIRPVSRIEQRVKEAEKLGFKTILVSKYAKLREKKYNINLIRVAKVTDLFAFLSQYRRNV